MPRTNDFLFLFSGGEPFTKVFNVDSDFNTTIYTSKQMSLTYGRSVMFESRGAGPNLDDNIDEVMRMINRFTNSRLDTIGRVCILARSEGCALALGLAAELNSKGITESELCFVGLSDLPMWDNGRNPGVRHVGKFVANPKPDENGATGAPFLNFKLGSLPVPNGVEPKVVLDKPIRAGKKFNNYQIEGNHMKWSHGLSRWIWTSSISDGEVHGKLDGFQDRRFRVPGNAVFDIDLSFHVNLNTGQPWKDMCKEAAQEFAQLPATPLP